VKRTLLGLFLAGVSTSAFASFTETFDDLGDSSVSAQPITPLIGRGWSNNNLSNPVGALTYFGGNSLVFGPQAGANYVAVNFNSGGGVSTLSNWLISPLQTFNNGDVISFWTRTVDSPFFPDRLQLRLSTAGSSTNVGASETSVGDFTGLLLDINPTYLASGAGSYPNAWTQFNATVTGLGGPTSGRFAFRYFVENGGPSGDNSDFIGIDTVSVTSAPVPEPASMAALGLGILAFARRRRK